VDKVRIPFFNTQMGKGVIDERHELFIGTAALSSKDLIHRAVDKADLIINVGHDVIEKPPFFMVRGGPKVIHVNFYSAEVDSVYFPDHEVVGDIANAIWQLKEAMTPSPEWNFSKFLAVRAEIDAHVLRDAKSPHFPIKPQRIVYDVRSVVQDDGILCLDNGMYKLWFARHYKAYVPNTLLLDNALATMGAGLPSAIAAKLLNPGRQVVAVVGDGGFLMNSQELITAVRLNLNLVVLLINDNCAWPRPCRSSASTVVA
jgi:acetolactate synthase I/II/III large subunit